MHSVIHHEMLTEMNYVCYNYKSNLIHKRELQEDGNKKITVVFLQISKGKQGWFFKHTWLNIIHGQTIYLHSRWVFTTKYWEKNKSKQTNKTQQQTRILKPRQKFLFSASTPYFWQSNIFHYFAIVSSTYLR